MISLETLRLGIGGHDDPRHGLSLLEAVACLAGEPHTNYPQCTSPVLGAFGRALNDILADEDRQRLVPLVPRLVGTAKGGVLDRKLMFMAVDWLVRMYTPTWLRTGGFEKSANVLSNASEVVSWSHLEALLPALQSAKHVAIAAWGVAWRIAPTARTEAWGVAAHVAWCAAKRAAWEAATNAAWDGTQGVMRAARAEIWDTVTHAAWSASKDAAWHAAIHIPSNRTALDDWNVVSEAAWEVLRPTISELQDSAISLFERMVATAERYEAIEPR